MKQVLFGKVKVFLFVILFALSIFTTYIYLTVGQKNFDHSLVLLSQQFLKHKIALPINNFLPIGDISDYKNNFYLYFGPLPSILLMPFVALMGFNTPQYLIGVISMIISFFAVYSLSGKFKFSKIDSLWLSLFFVFSSVLFSLSVMNITAYQVQSMGAPLILLGLNEYLGRKRSLIIGIFLGLAVMTRITLVFAVVFFIVEFLKKKLSLKQIALIALPLFIACLILGFYNQRRFHSFFETGYHYNISLKSFPGTENLKHGENNITHLPGNLYSFLVMPPQPLLAQPYGFYLKFPYLYASNWGMAIWYTSPLFLLLLFKFKKNIYTIPSILASVAIAWPLLTYYSLGSTQFGYRYALDFLPFLFLILIPSLQPKLSKLAIFLITTGVLFNLIYADSLFGIYPLLNIYK